MNYASILPFGSCRNSQTSGCQGGFPALPAGYFVFPSHTAVLKPACASLDTPILQNLQACSCHVSCIALPRPFLLLSTVLAIFLPDPVSVFSQCSYCLPVFPEGQQSLWLFQGTAPRHGHVLVTSDRFFLDLLHLLSILVLGLLYSCFPSFTFLLNKNLTLFIIFPVYTIYKVAFFSL